MDKKNYVILSLIVSILFLAICYLNLSSVLSLENNKINKDELWNVKITDMKFYKKTGNVNEINPPTYTNYIGNYDIEFNDIGDSITYEITVKNDGSMDAKLEDIIYSPKIDKNILINFSDLYKGSTLSAGEEKRAYVTIKYINKVNYYLRDNQSIILYYVQK